jgi:hypothetical protein
MNKIGAVDGGFQRYGLQCADGHCRATLRQLATTFDSSSRSLVWIAVSTGTEASHSDGHYFLLCFSLRTVPKLTPVHPRKMSAYFFPSMDEFRVAISDNSVLCSGMCSLECNGGSTSRPQWYCTSKIVTLFMVAVQVSTLSMTFVCALLWALWNHSCANFMNPIGVVWLHEQIHDRRVDVTPIHGQSVQCSVSHFNPLVSQGVN